MRLADCGEASQSLYSVNRVNVTVSARARCSGRVSESCDEEGALATAVDADEGIGGPESALLTWFLDRFSKEVEV